MYMKKTGLILALSFLTAALSFAEMRTWTSVSGSTIEAEYQRRNGSIVVLQSAEGKTIRFPYLKLSPDDRALVDSLDSSVIVAEGEKSDASIDAGLNKLIGSSKLFNAKGKKVDTAEGLSGKKAIGLYFSAHWCGPCRAFTPELVKAYKKMQSNDDPVEIIFVSSDRSEKDMYKYMDEADMPWLTAGLKTDAWNNLRNAFRVSGIPTFIVVDDKGEIITTNGRGDIGRHGGEAYKKAWN